MRGPQDPFRIKACKRCPLLNIQAQKATADLSGHQTLEHVAGRRASGAAQRAGGLECL
jgi:hypothetical protein